MLLVTSFYLCKSVFVILLHLLLIVQDSQQLKKDMTSECDQLFFIDSFIK